MIKKDIVKNISKRLGIDEDEINIIINCFMDEMSDGVESGKSIYLRGFGTFYFKTMKAKVGQDMMRGEQVVIPEHQKLYFRPGKRLAEGIKKLNK